MLGHDLDIMDVSEDEHVRTAPYLHSSPGWSTQRKAHAFLYGCPHTEHQAKAQAYQALRTPTAAQSFLGLFLHESRRYVCRLCTSHLCRVKRELLYRLQSSEANKTHKKHHKPQPNPQKRKQPVAQLVWPWRPCEKR